MQDFQGDSYEDAKLLGADSETLFWEDGKVVEGPDKIGFGETMRKFIENSIPYSKRRETEYEEWADFNRQELV